MLNMSTCIHVFVVATHTQKYPVSQSSVSALLHYIALQSSDGALSGSRVRRSRPNSPFQLYLRIPCYCIPTIVNLNSRKPRRGHLWHVHTRPRVSPPVGHTVWQHRAHGRSNHANTGSELALHPGCALTRSGKASALRDQSYGLLLTALASHRSLAPQLRRVWRRAALGW